MLHWQIDADGDDAVRLDYTYTRQPFVFNDRAAQLHRGPGFIRDAGKLGIALGAMRIADIEQSTFIIGIQEDRVAGANFPAIDVSAERALAEQ